MYNSVLMLFLSLKYLIRHHCGPYSLSGSKLCQFDKSSTELSKIHVGIRIDDFYNLELPGCH